jgi:hypothetical protein
VAGSVCLVLGVRQVRFPLAASGDAPSAAGSAAASPPEPASRVWQSPDSI